jgi:hypothetical protein
MRSPCCLCIPLFFFYGLYAARVVSEQCRRFVLPRNCCFGYFENLCQLSLTLNPSVQHGKWETQIIVYNGGLCTQTPMHNLYLYWVFLHFFLSNVFLSTISGCELICWAFDGFTTRGRMSTTHINIHTCYFVMTISFLNKNWRNTYIYYIYF